MSIQTQVLPSQRFSPSAIIKLNRHCAYTYQLLQRIQYPTLIHYALAYYWKKIGCCFTNELDNDNLSCPTKEDYEAAAANKSSALL
jgi:hypothetical protein